MNPNRQFHTENPWLRRLVLFAICYVFWLVLAWPLSPVDGRSEPGVWVVGLVVSAFVALVMRDIVRVNFRRFFSPASWFWGMVYLFVFAYYVLRGGLDVAWRVLHPDMPIRPGIVRMKTRLQTDTGRTALANSITLTPGTLTMEVTEDGIFYVHWLYATTTDDVQAAEQVLRRFEWFVGRILE